MKRLRGKAALDTWSQRLAAVKNDPTEDNLQALCSVLDEADSWVVRSWKGARHDDRLATFLRMRAEARDAQAMVNARRSSVPPVTRSAGLGAPVGGDAA